MRRLLLALALVLGGCSGCESERVPWSTGDAQPSAEPSGQASPPACSPRATERLGVPFSKLCEEDLPMGGARFAPVWIAAQPLACSGGGEGTMRCPPVTPLRHPAAREQRPAERLGSVSAAVIEADAAQSWCFMRFGGRLPTRQERARAELVFGMTSALLTRSSEEPPSLELSPLAEWVTEEPCETPLATQCRPGLYPSGDRELLHRERLVACDAVPVAPSSELTWLSLGDACPLTGLGLTPALTTLPCGVRSAAEGPAAPSFGLACRAVSAPPNAPPDAPATTAAVRCVMPGTAR